MPVVSGAGLVGRVVQVTGNRATVELITDPAFDVGVRSRRRRRESASPTARARADDLSVDDGSTPASRSSPGDDVVTSGRRPQHLPAGHPGRAGHRGADAQAGDSGPRWQVEPLGRPRSTRPTSSSLLWEPAVITGPRCAAVLFLGLGLPGRRSSPQLPSSGARGDVMLLMAHRRRARRRARAGRRGRLRRPGWPSTSCSRRRSGCRRWSTASSATCVGTRSGGSMVRASWWLAGRRSAAAAERRSAMVAIARWSAMFWARRPSHGPSLRPLSSLCHRRRRTRCSRHWRSERCGGRCPPMTAGQHCSPR